MNRNIIAGKLRELKGMATQKWGKLRHDEFAQLGGKKDQLVGKLQQSAGHAADEATRRANELADRQDRTPKA